MTDLPTRLEQAPEGSRKDSDDVLLALGWEPVENHYPDADGWYSPEGRIYDLPPDPTRSVDDGLALAGADWPGILDAAILAMWAPLTEGQKPRLERLPLFICAVLLRAHQAAKQQEPAA